MPKKVPVLQGCAPLQWVGVARPRAWASIMVEQRGKAIMLERATTRGLVKSQAVTGYPLLRVLAGNARRVFDGQQAASTASTAQVSCGEGRKLDRLLSGDGGLWLVQVLSSSRRGLSCVMSGMLRVHVPNYLHC